MLTDRAAKPSPTYISSERPQTPQEITDYTVYDLREAQYHGEHLTAARAHRSEVERRLAALDRFKMASPAVSTQAELNSSNAGLSQTDSGFSGTDQVRLGRIDPEDSQGTAPVGQISQNLPFSGSTAGYGVKSNDAPQYRSLGTPAAQTSGPKSLQADGVAAGQRQVTVHAVPADSSNLSKPGEAPPTPPRKGVPPQEGSHGQEAGARPGTASNMTAGRQRIPDIAVPSAVQLAKDQEGEDWVSKLIENLWPHIHDVTQDIAWESVPPVLEENRPSWVHSMELTKFTLGCKEPDITNVRCFRDPDDVYDDVFIEMDIEWKSEQDVEITMQVLGSDVSSYIPNFVEAQLAKLFTMVVGVEECYLKGTLQLALRPLFRRVPIVGAVQIGFTELPQFEFKPTIAGGPLGSALNAMLPAVHAWLKTTVQEAIFMPYVLPDHYFYQLDPAAQDVARPIGVVHCRIIEATGVPRMDTWPNYADNFVEMYISHTRRHRTSIVEGKNPRFDDVFAMPLHSQEHQKLRFTLWDYDAFSPDDEIGRCDIAISDLQEGEAHDLWLDVENEGEKKQKEAKQGEGPTQYSMGDRALRALAKPVAGHSVKKTQLHVKVHWRRWSDEEQQVINAAVKHGIRRALETPEGGRLDPDVKEMLMAGDLQVTVKTCNRIKVHGFFKRPSVKAVVKVGSMDEQETAPFKVSRRGNADLSGAPVEVHVDGNVAKHGANTSVTIKLQEVGFFSGGDTVGTLRLPLQRIMDAGYISGEYALDGEIGCFTPNVPGGGLPDTAEGGKVASSERGGGCGNMQGSGSGYVDPADPGSAGRNGGRSGGGRDGDDYEDRKRSKGSAVIELRWIPMFD